MPNPNWIAAHEPTARELAEFERSQNGREYRRLRLAASAPNRAGFLSQQMGDAEHWLAIVLAGAVDYENQHGTPGACIFSARDLLLAAVDLIDSYAAEEADLLLAEAEQERRTKAGVPLPRWPNK